MFYVLLHRVNNYSHFRLYLSGDNIINTKKGVYYEVQKNTFNNHADQPAFR